MKLLNIKFTNYFTIAASILLFVIIYLTGCKKVDILEKSELDLKLMTEGNS